MVSLLGVENDALAQFKNMDLLEQFLITNKSERKNELYREIIDEYVKPYSLEKENVLKSIYEKLHAENKRKEGNVLKLMYIHLLSVKGSFDRVNKLASELLSEPPQYFDDFCVARVYHLLGSNASKKLNFEEATKNFAIAENLARKCNDEEGLLNVEIGKCFKFLVMRQPDKLLEHLSQMESNVKEQYKSNFFPKINRLRTASYLLKAISENKDYESSLLKYAALTEQYAKQNKDYVTMFSNLFTVGQYYNTVKKDQDKAEEYLLEAIEFGKMGGSYREVVISYNTLIQNANQRGELDKVEQYSKEIIKLSDDVDLEEVRLEKYYNLAGLYLKKNENEKVMAMIDSIRSSTITAYSRRFDERFAELQTKYETAEKEKRIAILAKDNEMNKLVISQQNMAMKKNELEQENKLNIINLLSKDKLILNQNNELLAKDNELKSASLLNTEMRVKQQEIEKEKKDKTIEQLNTQQRLNRFRNGLIFSLLGLALLASIGAFIWFRSKQRHRETLAKQQYEVELLHSKLSALRSQMNPHFLFNSINSVNHFILKNEKQEASNYLTKYARLMRNVLEHSNEEYISLAEELETSKLYMDLERLRFNNGFEYEIKLEDGINPDEVLIQPLMLQPYIENSICHGFFNLQKKGAIVITAALHGTDKLKLCIDDNGVGREAAKEANSKASTSHKSMGLDITAARLSLGYAMENAISYIDKKDSEGRGIGTRVELLIPYEV